MNADVLTSVESLLDNAATKAEDLHASTILHRTLKEGRVPDDVDTLSASAIAGFASWLLVVADDLGTEHSCVGILASMCAVLGWNPIGQIPGISGLLLAASRFSAAVEEDSSIQLALLQTIEPLQVLPQHRPGKALAMSQLATRMAQHWAASARTGIETVRINYERYDLTASFAQVVDRLSLMPNAFDSIDNDLLRAKQEIDALRTSVR